MKRPTLRDVADHAEVGIATVERVLNGRGGVKPELAERVLRASKHLRYGIRRGLNHGIFRVEVILGKNDHHVVLNKCFQQISETLDPSIVLHRTFIDIDDIDALAQHIARPGFRRAGLIVVAPQHPLIRESILNAGREGVEVVQFLSRSAGDDIPYVGIDNYAVGRTAAHFMSKMLENRPGTFLALCHGDSFWVDCERMRGFSDYMSEKANPNHSFSCVFSQDDYDATVVKLQEALKQDDRIIGMYSIAPTKAVASVLQAWPKKIFWVGQALNEHAAACLRSGLMDMVLHQAPEVQAQRAIQTVLYRLGLIDSEVSADPVPFVIVTAQNLPPEIPSTVPMSGGRQKRL